MTPLFFWWMVESGALKHCQAAAVGWAMSCLLSHSTAWWDRSAVTLSRSCWYSTAVLSCGCRGCWDHSPASRKTSPSISWPPATSQRDAFFSILRSHLHAYAFKKAIARWQTEIANLRDVFNLHHQRMQRISTAGPPNICGLCGGKAAHSTCRHLPRAFIKGSKFSWDWSSYFPVKLMMERLSVLPAQEKVPCC